MLHIRNTISVRFTDFDVQFSTCCKDDNEITTMASTIDASGLLSCAH